MNLDHLEISDLDNMSTHGFNFLDDSNDSVVPTSEINRRTIELRVILVRDTNSKSYKLFEFNPSFSHASIYSVRPVNWDALRACVDFKNDYQCQFTQGDERVWMMSKFGMHGISFI